MRVGHYHPERVFERGAVILSFDIEQIWGYFDRLNERQFRSRYPNALEAHEKLLALLSASSVSATWFIVGGMALRQSDGAWDFRVAGLPIEWTSKIPGGCEMTAPLWYRPSFVERLREAQPCQEIGLHGGLTHLIWTDRRSTRVVVKQELAEGVKALEQALVRPLSFSFGREQEAYHELLPEHGILSYRGRTPVLACEMGPTLPGAILRAFDELTRATPPPVWPHETHPGLWNIPSSLFLYPIGPSRTAVLALRSRVQRVNRGLEAAIRHHGIFHFCLHPENLAESPDGFSLFEDILERLIRARDRGDIEILSMGQVAARMESTREARSTFRHSSISSARSRKVATKPF
jgi:peptidoglycan/xylan/chitin deacetylase (PgdA/CDA1 family)